MEQRNESLKFSLYFSFLQGNAKVPQMPETSLRLRKLLASEHVSLEQVVRLLHSNPPLAAYLLQFAESPLLRGARQSGGLQEVVSRLGMQRLNNLVMIFTVQHLFTKQDPGLIKVFRARWNEALLCAAYSACLAQQLTKLPLEDAMLGGLVQDIGSLSLLEEVENWFEQTPSEEELQALCNQLSGDAGVIVLSTWKLPELFIDCARYRSDWTRQHSGPADLLDVVQVARQLSDNSLDDALLLRLPAWHNLLGERAEELGPADLRTELEGNVSFWFKLLGGKGMV
ncbi:HDOD domain-containing protein [Pseudomonas sp. PDM14]|uniref:HDOD domain-containing protein n=1 Tax=Pseudomonas sp. PDM14 TaxID=2769288 RepID=UPI00178407A3|nr:HDOD domain-containing protein [Pseudomonas sp. PDM14]MBD9484847.1 HDOD domain-containing protein [Pseudomonas sp. PDM14]